MRCLRQLIDADFVQPHHNQLRLGMSEQLTANGGAFGLRKTSWHNFCDYLHCFSHTDYRNVDDASQ